jgi:hypothetical protein
MLPSASISDSWVGDRVKLAVLAVAVQFPAPEPVPNTNPRTAASAFMVRNRDEVPSAPRAVTVSVAALDMSGAGPVANHVGLLPNENGDNSLLAKLMDRDVQIAMELS